MSQPLPPAGWYADPATSEQMRYWDGSAWTQHTQPNPQPVAPQPAPQPHVVPAAPQPYAAAPAYQPAAAFPPQRQVQITAYNQRMANRVARRAHLTESAVAVAFTYNNLATMLIFGLI